MDVRTAADDRPLWDLHFTAFVVPAISVALELGLFEYLSKEPRISAAVAEHFRLNERGTRALLAVLASNGLLTQKGGVYAPSEIASSYLVPDSEYYWGPVFDVMRMAPISHDGLKTALTAREEEIEKGMPTGGPADNWAGGNIDEATARMIATYMQANSLTAASVAAERLDAAGITKLLDVGGGSGCFSIAFARAHATMRCGVMDLQAMCDVAMEYVREAGLEDRVTAEPCDMFRQDWPNGHDAVFMSNIFHDWNVDTCRTLVRKAFDILPSGGKIVLHEALFNDSYDGPATVAAFSLYMLIGTKGQQFTFDELKSILEDAGFESVMARPAHAYHFLISAEKP